MDLIQFFGRFHVLVLHLPIGILMLAAGMEMHSLFKKTPRHSTFNWVWFWGTVSAAAACVLGWMLSQGEGYTPEAIFIHRSFGISVVVIGCICWYYFKNVNSNKTTTLHQTVGYSLAAIQLLVLFSTGHYGANMTHGETYLVDKAPNIVRVSLGFPEHPKPRPPIKNLADADVYLDVVQPMLQSRCTSCHNEHKQKGKLNLATLDGLTKGGRSGHTIVAGNANESELYQRITLDHSDKKFMPAEGKTPFSDEQVNIIKWWIDNKAPFSGTVTSLALSKKDKKNLHQFLGIYDQTSVASLPKIEAISQAQKNKLRDLGFVVKEVSQTLPYLDLNLTISGNPLTDEIITELSKIKSHIVWLNLAGTKVTPSQLTTIASFENLMRLKLENNQLSNDDISVLIKLNKLTYLNLYGNPVDDDILTLVNDFPALKKLYLSNTKVTPEAVNSFNQRSELNVNYVAYDKSKVLSQSEINASPTSE